MLVLDLYGWWYSRGFGWVAHQLFVVSVKRVTNFFSMTALLRTLFAPFRQDALQLKNAPLQVKLQAFGGNIISRIFGFFIRSGLILVGLLTLLFNFCVGIIGLALWPLLPLSPLIALALVITKVGA